MGPRFVTKIAPGAATALLCATHALAALPEPGQRIDDLLDDYRTDGYRIVYSTRLVTPAMRVGQRPSGRDPRDALTEALAAHGLTLSEVDGVFYVVRATPDAPNTAPGSILAIVKVAPTGDRLSGATLALSPRASGVVPLASGAYQFDELAPGSYEVSATAPAYGTQTRRVEVRPGLPSTIVFELEPGEAKLRTLTISASHYDLVRDFKSSSAHFAQAEVENMADLGEDPLRIVQRLPGTAGGGISARSHVRGGDDDEMLLVYEGLELIEPFHIRDYQSIFSTIDQRAIADVQVYTGGFPVDYGGRMSGVMLIEPLVSDRVRHEIGLSVYNTSLLSSGTFADGRGDWLGIARRGNLDLVVDPEYGRPSFSDVLGRIGWEFGNASRLSLNALVSNDDIEVIVEDAVGDQERSRSDTGNDQVWLKVDTDWRPGLVSSTVLSRGSFRNLREGMIDEEDKISGTVRDRRRLTVLGVKQDWQWIASRNHLLKWGVQYKRLDADFEYESEFEYFDLFLGFPGAQPMTVRSTLAESDGDSFGVYLADRVRLTPRLTAELGLRWDKQTYLGAASDDQMSPRVNLLYRLNDDTELRGSWGRYHQAQEIQSLQLEDGSENYHAAQRADHSILSVERRFDDRVTLRVEAYWKDMDRLRPRYENLFDPLAILPELGPDRVQILPQSSRARGVEVFLTGETSTPLTWWASAAYARTEDRIDGEWIARSWDQRRAFDAGLNYTDRRWDLSVVAKYRSGWPTTAVSVDTLFLSDGSTAPEFSYGPRNDRRLSSFQSLDFRIARRFDVKRGSLSVFLEVINALNRDNTCCVDWDAEPDDAGVWQLERSEDFWLPRLPAVGVRWEF